MASRTANIVTAILMIGFATIVTVRMLKHFAAGNNLNMTALYFGAIIHQQRTTITRVFHPLGVAADLGFTSIVMDDVEPRSYS